MAVPGPRHWLTGLALSLALAWAAGALLLDTVQPVAFDHAVGHYVPLPGTTTRTRAEGWATSSVGEHGIRGLPGGTLPSGPKVVFWGDSYVEGLQVGDAQRMAQVFSAQARSNGLNIMGVGIATGGNTLIDSIVTAPGYARALGHVPLHVFVLGRITDVLPDDPRPCRAAFYSRPEPHIVPVDCPPSEWSLRFAPQLRKLELSGAFTAYQKLKEQHLRLNLGPAKAIAASATAPGPESKPRTEAWNFLIAQTRRAAAGPVLFLYLPATPIITQGGIQQADTDDTTALAFADACARNGVPFLNLGPAFLAHYQTTGRMPRGFFNSPPGSGHLNEDGHKLVAQAVFQYIKEHRDALLAP